MSNDPEDAPGRAPANPRGKRSADFGGAAEPREGRCGAKLRCSDPVAYCLSFPARDRNRCRLHGGASPRGIESAQWKGRGYSRDIPARLMDRFAQGLDDPELTSLRSEISLLDARMGELLNTLPEENARDVVSGIRSAYQRIVYLCDRPDLDGREERLSSACADIGTALELLQDEQVAWKEVYSVITLRRRAALAEVKREESLEHTMIHAQALQFFATLLTVIHEEVEDPELKKRLALKIGIRLNRPALPSE